MFPFLTEQQPGGFLIRVHAKPGARVSAFAAPLALHHTEVDLRIAAPPVEGQANAELVRFFEEVVEQGLRELQRDSTGFVEGTSYAQVVAAESAAAETQLCTSDSVERGDKKSQRKGKGRDAISSASNGQKIKSSGGKASAPAVHPPGEVFPARVDVTLVRGGTSREKTVLALFPGTRAQLLAILEKASHA
ncbi:hypothetical protein ABB37_03301 [Leptomonas pyrrhocoris]|uniref:Uncharacterized protein n=1 Tax=Leptomonas pyrrhocoris TaxID=157538 RepID=A0A0N0DWU2_LEPPY|nr:hypothetical protein ABB37_03301 [Leptomonas pyrrhocoris]KPA82172.1 hypothetical protein ABB37_03301 [Leptomonas pyrrhocoris]|eukprot:XP_015660611.1 hypothetical protein ABB37_03301 [Leptomonas pyrrhocoris]